jgi:hypothetical protein
MPRTMVGLLAALGTPCPRLSALPTAPWSGGSLGSPLPPAV